MSVVKINWQNWLNGENLAIFKIHLLRVEVDAPMIDVVDADHRGNKVISL